MVHIISVTGWPRERVDEAGGWEAYLQLEKRREKSKKTYFIFDEAQVSYVDDELWSNFFRILSHWDNQFAIAFASHGSLTSELSMQSTPFQFQLTPYFVNDWQTITLYPIDHHDGLGSVGLLLTRTEFDELTSKQFPSPDYYFDLSFFNAIFDLTGGHVGAVLDLVKIISASDVRFFMMSGHIT